MRSFVLTLAAGLAVASAVAAAAPGPNDKATICLDPSGISHPPLCHSQSATRFPDQPDICICNGPYRTVDAPWCAPGESPAADTAAFDRARVAYAAAHHNSVIGFTFEGRRSCVSLSHTG